MRRLALVLLVRGDETHLVAVEMDDVLRPRSVGIFPHVWSKS